MSSFEGSLVVEAGLAVGRECESWLARVNLTSRRGAGHAERPRDCSTIMSNVHASASATRGEILLEIHTLESLRNPSQNRSGRENGYTGCGRERASRHAEGAEVARELLVRGQGHLLALRLHATLSRRGGGTRLEGRRGGGFACLEYNVATGEGSDLSDGSESCNEAKGGNEDRTHWDGRRSGRGIHGFGGEGEASIEYSEGKGGGPERGDGLVSYIANGTGIA